MAQKGSLIGQMKEVVVFYNNSAQTALGAGFNAGYVSFVTTRGKLKQISGRKTDDFGNITFENYYILVCRYQNALAENLTNDTVLAINGQLYGITTYQLIDERKAYYQFNLTAKIVNPNTSFDPGFSNGFN